MYLVMGGCLTTYYLKAGMCVAVSLYLNDF